MMRCNFRDRETQTVCRKVCKPFEEFDIRPIDEYGDCIDPDCGYDNEAQAIAAMADHLGNDCVAVVCERHTGESCREHGIRDDEYATVKTIGDDIALVVGGWKL